MRLSGVLLAAGLLCAAPAGAHAASGDAGANGAEAWACTDTLTLAGADGVTIEPAGLTVDAFGNRWVSDAARHRLVRFDARGAHLDETGTLGSEANQFRRPGALARWGASAVVVLDRENRRVVAYDAHGRRGDFVVDLAASALESAVGRIEAVGLAADRGGALYVADADRDRVLVFDFGGEYQRSLGGYGSGAGAFHHLAAIAAGPKGELVTVEWMVAARRKGAAAATDSVRAPRARVQRLESGGAALAQWEFPCADHAVFALAVDESGRIAVADGSPGGVRVFARDGALLALLDGAARPTALAFAADGALLVAEPGRLLRFAPVVERARD